MGVNTRRHDTETTELLEVAEMIVERDEMHQLRNDAPVLTVQERQLLCLAIARMRRHLGLPAHPIADKCRLTV